MANLTIRREKLADPFAFFRDFIPFDPFRDMEPAVFEEKFAFAPPFEVKETKEGYTFKADVPGVTEKELEVTIDGNRLLVTGKREAEREEKDETFFVYERSFGKFTRAFTLPDGADFEHITSRLDGGVLTIVVPKKPEVMPKKIAVKVETKTKA